MYTQAVQDALKTPGLIDSVLQAVVKMQICDLQKIEVVPLVSMAVQSAKDQTKQLAIQVINKLSTFDN